MGEFANETVYATITLKDANGPLDINGIHATGFQNGQPVAVGGNINVVTTPASYVSTTASGTYAQGSVMPVTITYSRSLKHVSGTVANVTVKRGIGTVGSGSCAINSGKMLCSVSVTTASTYTSSFTTVVTFSSPSGVQDIAGLWATGVSSGQSLSITGTLRTN